MTDRMPPISAADALAETTRAQNSAADPQASAWVNANAGTGKTHVLTLRVLRLLLAGTAPERILCLTYTKAAAAEMSKRVFDKLGEWVTAPESQLLATLEDILRYEPNAEEIKLARTLFTKAIETPGGLKVQTIHAFAERLLQRFPLEAGVPPGFKILDDVKGAEIKARAIEGTLATATAAPDSPLGRALSLTVRYASEASFEELLSKTIMERAWLDRASRFKLGENSDDFAGVEAYLRRQFGVSKDINAQDLELEAADVLPRADLQALRDHLNGGGKTDISNAAILTAALGETGPSSRVECLEQFFLVNRRTSREGARKSLMSKALHDARPDLVAIAERAQQRFITLMNELRSLKLLEATIALYRLAADVLQRYTNAKRTSGALDFDDLIEKTRWLLTSNSADWVLYKLDGGLDHILVDEAQDTSPVQWEIISALAREFFSGTSARDVRRTVFAVGDEKQSIYSFQGAAPEMFAKTGEHFAAIAAHAEISWRRVPLNLSFRTVQPVLDSVDEVFCNASATPGLTSAGDRIRHIARRLGHSGLIEIWPTEKPADAELADPWDPLADSSEQAPANRLADRIADTIDRWLRNGEKLHSENRPVRPGDILILVRKRNPFAVPMVAALKKRHIPVAGSDRVKLTDQIAVQDLLVLGDFLTLPEDDLALATVLKGPIFGFTDDDLLAIAPHRKGSLWKALLAHADDHIAFKPAAETLKRWRAKADFTPPFEFFSSVLDREGARDKFLHRLGPEAADAIDEFLDIALSYDDSEPPSLTGFLANLRATNREIKRDMEHGRDEVRVMTVHGAKGLEAPIVFLPDTCSTASGEGPGPALLKLAGRDDEENAPDPIVWPIKGTSNIPAIAEAKTARDAREREERNRLLYVAMTRARDRLYVGGFERKQSLPPDCWYELIATALKPRLQAIEVEPDRTIWRLETPQSAPHEKPRSNFETAIPAEKLPPFAETRITAEPRLSVPLAPSRLEPYAPDSEGEPVMREKPDPAETNDAPSPLAAGHTNRFLRGTLTHALLQHLPEIDEQHRQTAAKAFVDKRGAALSAGVRASIVRETLAILADPSFAPLFAADSLPEVPIAAFIPRPNGKGPALELSGQIDRLALTEQHVLIVDYKTNRPPPKDAINVADAYLFQLAAYALALQEIYPQRTIKAALLWTDGPRLMEIPESMIESYIKRLWDLDVASLDAS